MQVVVLVLGALLALAVTIIYRQLRSLKSLAALRASNGFATEILENAGEGIVVYDRELRYVIWNRFMEELTGIAAEEVLGKSAPDVFPHLREQQIDDLIRRALAGESVASPDIHDYVPGGARQGWISAVYRPHFDANGSVAGVIGVIRDITARKAAEQQIEYQAYHDALTGLANRRLFQEHLTLALALAQRHDRLVAVLFLDLDHFKLINDSLGHSVGDSLLRQIAARLKSSLREGDTVARVGGDEFTIVLQELSSRSDAAVVAQKVLRAISEPLELSGHRLYVTTSIGITIFPDDGVDAETLLRNADTAMYRAKSEGRNRYESSTEELSRSTEERMQLESGLHQAIERGEFELYYQPQVDLRTMEIAGMEALLRWHHPERGVLLPSAFISVAEQGEMIVTIGNWVIREACLHAVTVRERGLSGFRVAVNLSARQFRDPSLLETVASALRESGLHPQSLELEITESVAMENVNRTLETLTALRALGVTIAIDDFGTGHSSLSYLKLFPIDTLKIDRSFVDDLTGRAEDGAIVASIIQLAEGLRLRVIAEGVETSAQVDFLRAHNCGEVQGFHFSYPLPADEFEDLVARLVS